MQQLLQPDRSPNTATMLRVFTILAVLLIAQTTIGLLGDVLDLLALFRSELYLFIAGALLAYLMSPAVRMLQHALRKTWAAVIGAYLLLFVLVLGAGALLLTPFVSQAQALRSDTRSPSSASLVRLSNLKSQLGLVESQLSALQSNLSSGSLQTSQVLKIQTDTTAALTMASDLASSQVPSGQVQIPPSYAKPIVADVLQLQSAYVQVVRAAATTISPGLLAQVRTVADQAYAEVVATDNKAASTPLLLLSAQVLLDQHGIVVDLHDKFSQVLKTVNDQVTSLLNNAINVGLQAGSLLIDVVLVFIMSIYFIVDGNRFIQWIVHVVPKRSQPQVSLAIANLDRILGRYIRTQLLLALVAGGLDATGAVIIGIPYPSVIFFSSFLLSLVPVIGPVVLPIPPLAIALIFSPLPKPIVYLVWLLVGEQFDTNVLGPRLQGHRLGIHPLEAMAAALLGLPLAGIAGAFFAVPIVAFVHIVIRELLIAQRAPGPAPAQGAPPASGPSPGGPPG